MSARQTRCWNGVPPALSGRSKVVRSPAKYSESWRRVVGEHPGRRRARGTLLVVERERAQAAVAGGDGHERAERRVDADPGAHASCAHRCWVA